MVRSQYLVEFYLACYVFWDHDPYPIGRTIRKMSYLQVFLNKCWQMHRLTLFITYSVNFKKAIAFHIAIHMLCSSE